MPHVPPPILNKDARAALCSGLRSQSDPMAVVFQSSASGQTTWKEAGRTDVVANTAGAYTKRRSIHRLAS